MIFFHKTWQKSKVWLSKEFVALRDSRIHFWLRSFLISSIFDFHDYFGLFSSKGKQKLPCHPSKCSCRAHYLPTVLTSPPHPPWKLFFELDRLKVFTPAGLLCSPFNFDMHTLGRLHFSIASTKFSGGVRGGETVFWHQKKVTFLNTLMDGTVPPGFQKTP